MRHGVGWLVFVGSFGLRHSFVIRHWAFVIDFYQSLASKHTTAVAWRRLPCSVNEAMLMGNSLLTKH